MRWEVYMPAGTLVIVFGAWLLLLVLMLVVRSPGGDGGEDE